MSVHDLRPPQVAVTPPASAVAGSAVLRVGAGPLSLPLACRGARCTVRVTVSAGGLTLASASRSVAVGGHARLGAPARRALARRDRTRATVVVSARANGTWRVTSRRTVLLVPVS